VEMEAETASGNPKRNYRVLLANYSRRHGRDFQFLG
jgi:hypothetical protein